MNPDSAIPVPPPACRHGVIALIAWGDRRDEPLSRQSLLVIRRSARVVAPGRLCFPGGGVEPGETATAALVREICEECGIRCVPSTKFAESVTPWKVRLEWWTASIAHDAVPIPNPMEIAEIIAMTPTELSESPDTLESNREILQRIINCEFDSLVGIIAEP